MDFRAGGFIDPTREQGKARAGGEDGDEGGREPAGTISHPARRVERRRITSGAFDGPTTQGPGRHLLLR